jgi:hypothetical protein
MVNLGGIWATWHSTYSPKTMKKVLVSCLLGVTAAASLVVAPADAKVLKEGAATNGYYWQLIERNDGQTRWLCRKTGEKRIQTHSACNSAGAKRP